MGRQQEKRMAKLESEDFDHKLMVFCKLVKTYVGLEFCLQGGPMKARGICKHLKEIQKDEKGEIQSIIDMVPTRQLVIKTIIGKKE